MFLVLFLARLGGFGEFKFNVLHVSIALSTMANISGSSLQSGSHDTVFGTLTVQSNGTATLAQTAADATVYELLATASGSAAVEQALTSLHPS